MVLRTRMRANQCVNQGAGVSIFISSVVSNLEPFPSPPIWVVHGIAEQGAFGLVEFDHRVNAARGDRDVLGEGGVTRADVGIGNFQRSNRLTSLPSHDLNVARGYC